MIKFLMRGFLDSACSFHMCPERKYFNMYRACDASTIMIGNGSASRVVGIGTVKMKMFDGVVRKVDKVLENINKLHNFLPTKPYTPKFVYKKCGNILVSILKKRKKFTLHIPNGIILGYTLNVNK